MSETETISPAAPPAREWVHIGSMRTTFPGDLETAREQFARYKALHLRNLFEPQFLDTVMRLSAATAFGPGEPDAPGFREAELTPSVPAASSTSPSTGRSSCAGWKA